MTVGRVSGERREALEEGHRSSPRPGTYQDPVTRPRQILCLHCCLMSAESLGAHSPNKNSNRRATDVQVTDIQCPQIAFVS